MTPTLEPGQVAMLVVEQGGGAQPLAVVEAQRTRKTGLAVTGSTSETLLTTRNRQSGRPVL